MRYCPQCRSEYREGFERCADCDVALVAELPPVPVWKEAFSGDAVKADIVRSALETADIETIAPDEMTTNLGWYAPGAIGMIRILVKESDLPAAREIIEGIHRLGTEIPPDDDSRSS